MKRYVKVYLWIVLFIAVVVAMHFQAIELMNSTQIKLDARDSK